MPVITKQDLENLDNNCAICLKRMDLYSSNNWPLKLTCKHIFHADCIAEWAVTSKSDRCPLCRKPDINEGYYPDDDTPDGRFKWTKLE